MTTTTVTYLTQAQVHAAQHLSSRENTVIWLAVAGAAALAALATGARRTIKDWRRG